jgi:hypothetical protein
MSNPDSTPKAIFLSLDGSTYPDTLICSGVITFELSGKPCPYSQAGRTPDDPSIQQKAITHRQGATWRPATLRQITAWQRNS